MKKEIALIGILVGLVSCNQDDDVYGKQDFESYTQNEWLYNKGEAKDSIVLPPPSENGEEGDPPPNDGPKNGGKPFPQDSIKLTKNIQ